ncbi:coiled-coil domain-containing protein 122-like isoform X5 [Perca fluviatilis]|uniref:coiled-coil domain-containing protein 122-like isoform X5 n=1 Tax=Perca fluviatilis TaxID=8168 RepID=UPI00196296CC|nr:coiled-coil domain-containing protein 122-like isoform X5 [Perca fluviatilis]
MSNLRASEIGTQDKSGFSLTKAVEDVSQHSCAQTEALKEKQKTLISLQATLSEVEKIGGTAEQELRSKVREFLMLEGEMEHLERQTRVLHDHCASIRKENTELQIGISEEEENARMALAGFKAYRNKMEVHRAAVLHAASQTEAHKELEEKRALVRMLTQKKEELKSEIDALKGEISLMRETIAKTREKVQKELETHTQIKKDIEIQNRRYEAIVKRLRCQLSRAQAAHRQMSEDVYHMERELAQLKGQLMSSQDSAGGCSETKLQATSAWRGMGS